MLNQLANKKTETMAIASYHTAHSCKSYNHVFALHVSMPRFNSIDFYQNKSKLKLFCPKNAKFSSAWGSAKKKRDSPLLQVSGYAHASNITKTI